jgi:hypothetical protein
MELSSIKHIEPDQLSDYQADLFITCLGFESRSTQVARLFEGRSCQKIVLENEKLIREFSYHENRNYLESQHFEFFPLEAGFPFLDQVFRSLKKDDIQVALDCTNMSPRWYYELFKWFDRKHLEDRRVHLRVFYTMAAYVRQTGTRKVKKLISFLKEDVKSAASRKTALILGLGQEKQVAESIFQLVNPDLLFLYYADPPVEKHFVKKVFENNHNLINQTPIRNLIAYPIRNGQTIYQSLINTILPLRNEYSIVLVTHGPKIFSLVSMLVHLGYPDISIFYPRFKKQSPSDRLPKDEPVVLDILFEGEE